MAVVLFDHSRIGVAEILGYDQERRAGHHTMRRVCVTQCMEVCGWLNLRLRAGLPHRAILIRLPPAVAGRFAQDQFDPGPASGKPTK